MAPLIGVSLSFLGPMYDCRPHLLGHSGLAHRTGLVLVWSMIDKSPDMNIQTQTWMLTFGKLMTMKVQYPICYVLSLYISIYKVGVNGHGHLDGGRRHPDIMDGLTLKKSLGNPF